MIGYLIVGVLLGAGIVLFYRFFKGRKTGRTAVDAGALEEARRKVVEQAQREMADWSAKEKARLAKEVEAQRVSAIEGAKEVAEGWRKDAKASAAEMFAAERGKVEYELRVLKRRIAELGEQAAEREALNERLGKVAQDIRTFVGKVETLSFTAKEALREDADKGKLPVERRLLPAVSQIKRAADSIRLEFGLEPKPLYDALYKWFYEVPLKNLISKAGVVGVSGVYRIVAADGRIYVGQSTDIGERWKTHLKRGIGCDGLTAQGGRLYSLMAEEGVESFRFELVEECERALLNERERWYIALWNSSEVGLNLKRGG